MPLAASVPTWGRAYPHVMYVLHVHAGLQDNLCASFQMATFQEAAATVHLIVYSSSS